MENKITFKLTGRYGLFTDPATKIGGEKSTLMIPTYQALKGVCESIYWKPSIIWYIDRICINNPIHTESKGIRPISYSGGNDLAYYTYLSDVEYIVEAHFEFNRNRPDLQKDFCENKHFFISKRCLEKGGRRDIFLGTRECQGYVEPCEFTNENSCYKNTPIMEFGFQFHSFAYPDETGNDELIARFWNPIMGNGIITFIRPQECNKTRFVKKMELKKFDNTNFSGTEENEILNGYKEGEA